MNRLNYKFLLRGKISEYLRAENSEFKVERIGEDYDLPRVIHINIKLALESRPDFPSRLPFTVNSISYQGPLYCHPPFYLGIL